MSMICNRRRLLTLCGRAAAAFVFAPRLLLRAEQSKTSNLGVVCGEPLASAVGNQTLAEGGNSVDAAVAAALTACVVSPHNCGVGGYGGHMVIASGRNGHVAAIDFNSAAPSAAQPDMYARDDRGVVRGRSNELGWLSVGVPGTLAGLQLALERFGTRSFREASAPAIRLAKNGFVVSRSLAAAIRHSSSHLRKDAALEKLFFINGSPLTAGQTSSNPELSQLLQALAEDNSVDRFYRGDMALRMAEAFEKNGGLLAAKDLAAYQAREVKPLKLAWRGSEMVSAPLTAGGLTVFEGLSFLRALEWERLNSGRVAIFVEAIRAAWRDRLQLLGDPEKVNVPVDRLLSSEYAQETAAKIKKAVKQRQLVPFETDNIRQGGTVHLSAGDREGDMTAITLTHGNSFGAQVIVGELGMILGHGMSRFNPWPGHPNSIAPGKRPLHNMCPTIVIREGSPVLAVGGAGGRKIPNALYAVLAHYAGGKASVLEAMNAPRLHTEGNLTLLLERTWPKPEGDYLSELGYTIRLGSSALVSAVARDPKTGNCHAMTR